MLEYHVLCAISKGRISIARGGPRSGPNAPGPEKLAVRARMPEIVSRVADRIREAVLGRMKQVDQHCLRMTHRTWALLGGVPEILIDRQLGHSTAGGDAAMQVAWSLIGRKHYTDMKALARDARQSPDAVRQILESARNELKVALAEGRSALAVEAPKSTARRRA